MAADCFKIKEFNQTEKTVDEDPAGYQRWISRKEMQSAKILRTKKREVQRLLKS